MSFLVFKDNTRTSFDNMNEGKELSFGSSFECDIISDAKGVAALHCSFYKKENDIYIKQVSKKFKFKVNGKEIENECCLRHKDNILIGDEAIQFFEKELKEDSFEEKKNALKLKIHKLLLERMNLKKLQKSDYELNKKAKEAIKALIDEFEVEVLNICGKEELIKEITDEAIGLGALEEFLADKNVTEIMVKNSRNIYIEQKGKLILTDKKFLNDEQLLGVIERIVAPIGRRIDESSPIVDARLSDGSRVNAVIPPIALDGPALTIRKFSKTPFKINDLIKFGSMNENIATLLSLAVKYRQNVVISGGTGSGKTTLLNVLSSFIPDDERIVTIEDSAELQLPQNHVIRMEARPPNIEGKGRISIRDLVINSLRMRPDRIVVGECRGGESLDMLQAMNTGHDGSLTTLHANTPRDALSRLETMVMMSGMELPSRAIREQIAMAVNIIVQQSRLADGTRKITHVTEIVGVKDMNIEYHDIMVFKQKGISEEGKIIGNHEATGYIPQFIKKLCEKGINISLNIFNNNKEDDKSDRD